MVKQSKKVLWVMNTQDKTGYFMSPALIWWYGILENMGYEVYYYSYENYNIEELYQQVKQNEIDYVIVGAYSIIHTELIRLREHTQVYVLQSDDRWRYADFSKFWIPFVDGIITFEGEESNYISDGLKHEQFNKMRWSFNPTTMATLEPLGKNVVPHLYTLTHTGGIHGNRQDIINQFISKGIPVHVDQSLDYEMTKHIWNQSSYSLCVTNNSLNTGKELKGRVVEIPNWCVLLTEPFPDMEQYYDLDNEIVIFNSVDEAVEKINRMNVPPYTEMKRIKDNGKRRLWNSNTVYHAWNKILPNIDPDYKVLDPIQILKEKHGDYYYA